MIMRIYGILWCPLICCLLQEARTLNIVSLGTVKTHSHFLWTDTVLTELLSRGHKITELTFKEPAPHRNRTTFVLESGVYPSEMYAALIDSANRNHFLYGIYNLFKLNIVEFKDQMSSKAFQRLKEHLLGMRETVDLILVDYAHRDLLIGVSQLVGNPPVVVLTAYNHPGALNTVMGSPQIPALVPHEESPFSCEMTFSERVVNFIAHSTFRLIEVCYFEPAMNQLLREAISPDSLSLTELEQNISIAMVNTHPTTHCQQATTASIVEVGFLHIKPPKSLPKDIQKFLDEAENGVIVVSFGTMIRPDFVPGLQDTLLEICRTLKQRFLWKMPNPPKNLPPNVLAPKWLPQSDVLAHPNVRLIITHGGTLSMQEAVYRGVPILMIPFFLDQKTNANRVASRGVGRTLDYSQLTVEALSKEVKSILENDTYKDKMRYLSSIAQDQPETALQRAVYWVEFVGRHRGANHLRKDSRQMTWIQYYSIDVIAFLSFVIILALALSLICIRFLMTWLFGTRRKIKTE